MTFYLIGLGLNDKSLSMEAFEICKKAEKIKNVMAILKRHWTTLEKKGFKLSPTLWAILLGMYEGGMFKPEECGEIINEVIRLEEAGFALSLAQKKEVYSYFPQGSYVCVIKGN